MKEFSALLKRVKAESEWLNYRAGLICATVANCYRDPRKNKPFTPQDFMPTGRKRQQTPEEMLETVKRWQALYEAN